MLWQLTFERLSDLFLERASEILLVSRTLQCVTLDLETRGDDRLS